MKKINNIPVVKGLAFLWRQMDNIQRNEYMNIYVFLQVVGSATKETQTYRRGMKSDKGSLF